MTTHRHGQPGRFRAPGFLVYVFLACTAACGGGGDGGAADNAIKVGAIFDLTGPTADVGTDYADGMRGYADWLNLQGGIEGRPIDLIYQDYAYQIDRAEQLYSQFVSEGAVVFMGWGTGDTEALRLRVTEDEIPVQFRLALPRSGRPGRRALQLPGRPYLHRPVPYHPGLDRGQPRRGYAGGGAHAPREPLRAVSVAVRRRRIRRGDRGRPHPLRDAARRVDYTGEFSRIRQSGAQYVVFQNTSGPAAVALQNATSLGLDLTFICLNWCANAQLVDLAGEDAEGVMGTIPYAPLSVDVPGTRVIRDYLAGKGETIEGKTNAYTQAWWTFSVFAEAMRRVVASGRELTGANIKAALETFTDLDMGGVTVPISFTPDDHLGAKGLRLFRVEDGEWVPFTEFIQAPAAP